MACGHCSCGGNGGHHGKSRSANWAIFGIAAAIAGVVGMAVAFQPETKPSPKPPGAAAPEKPAGDKSPQGAPASPYVLGHTMKRIDGTEESLETYKGKVVLIVNVASKCGLTPQYAALEKLYKDKKDAGLVVLGFPANNFRSQEPGTNKEIAEFCTSKYSVSFPMFEKISVLGEDQHPLYKQLSSQPSPIGGDPTWNFTKFVVDRSGHVVARFEPQTKPDDAAVVKKIEELLAAK